MVDTTTITPPPVYTREETTTSPSEIYHKPPPSYGFANPAAFKAVNQPSTSVYTYDQQAAPPAYGHSPVISTQPMAMRGGVVVIPGQTADINDYMAWSIFNICCCGLLFGLIGLMLSSQVRDRKLAGDIEGARQMSTWTAIWNAFATLAGIGIIIGLVFYLQNSRYY